MKKFLRNCTIRKKMIVSHGTIALFGLWVTFIGLIGISMLIGRLDGMHTGPVKSTAAVGDVLFYSSDIKGGITGILSQRSNAYFDAFNQMMQADAETVSGAIATLKSSLDYIDDPKAQELVKTLEQTFIKGEAVRSQIMEAIKKGDFDTAATLYGMDYRVTLQEMQTIGKELSVLVEEGTSLYHARSLKDSNNIIASILFMTVVCLILGVALTHFVTAAVRVPVRQLMDASMEMKQGNLSVADAITYESKDELGHLAESMRETLQFLYGYVAEISQTLEQVADGNLTTHPEQVSNFRGDFASIKKSLVYILDNLNATLSEISLASAQVNSGAIQIAAGAQTLAHGATEQTSSVERLSNAVSDMTQQVNMTADHAVEARQTMQTTAEQIRDCNAQMTQMMSAMDNITQQAAQISHIVKTIDDIAFQTNILALNAAVEAARAGAAGKGFAVVADEVRNLAAKSAEAAKTTTDLIGGTVDAVQNGTSVLSGTAQKLLSVVEGSEKSAELVDEIAQAARGQADAIGQIGDSLEQISGVVYTTSSTAEESASASEELSGQATALNDLLGTFRLRDKDK